MYDIKSIEHYKRAGELIADHGRELIPDNIFDIIDNIDAFEYWDYYLIDGKTVVVTDGQIANNYSLEKFIDNAICYVIDNDLLQED